jgi:hypothetical protein
MQVPQQCVVDDVLTLDCQVRAPFVSNSRRIMIVYGSLKDQANSEKDRDNTIYGILLVLCPMVGGMVLFTKRQAIGNQSLII